MESRATTWRSKNPERAREQSRLYRLKNKERIKEYNAQMYKTIEFKQRRKQYRGKYAPIVKLKRWNNKLKIIEIYGSKCAHCGDNNPYHLTIDHINNDGAKHRKENKLSAFIYKWIKQNNYVKDTNLQLLCWNCNMSKGVYGFFPDVLIPETI